MWECFLTFDAIRLRLQNDKLFILLSCIPRWDRMMMMERTSPVVTMFMEQVEFLNVSVKADPDMDPATLTELVGRVKTSIMDILTKVDAISNKDYIKMMEVLRLCAINNCILYF